MIYLVLPALVLVAILVGVVFVVRAGTRTNGRHRWPEDSRNTRRDERVNRYTETHGKDLM